MAWSAITVRLAMCSAARCTKPESRASTVRPNGRRAREIIAPSADSVNININIQTNYRSLYESAIEPRRSHDHHTFDFADVADKLPVNRSLIYAVLVVVVVWIVGIIILVYKL